MNIARSISNRISYPIPHKITQVPTAILSSGAAIDADVSAFLDATGITDDTQIAAITQLVADWKAAGQWERTVAIYPFVGGTSFTHKFNLKDPRDLDAANRLSFSGTITHNANGVTTDGSTSIGNTHIDLNLQLPQYSASCFFYNRTAAGPGASDYGLCGARNQLFFDMYSTNRLYLGLNAVNYTTGVTYGPFMSGVASYQGLIGFSINGPASISFYRNATRLNHDTQELAYYWSNTGTIASRKLWLFGNNNSGALQWPLDARNIAFVAVTYSQDPTSWGLLNSAIQTFQTTLGRNV